MNGESEIPPLRSSNGEFAYTDKKKAELLNEVYINQNISVGPCSFPCGPTNINELFKLSCVTTGEVDRVVRNLPSKTSPIVLITEMPEVEVCCLQDIDPVGV